MRILIAILLSFMPLIGAEDQGEVHEGDYFVTGGEIQLSGIIRGDVYAVGSKVIIAGQVEGDVIASGSTVEISGKVFGNARLAGGEVLLTGEIGHNFTAIGASVQMTKDALVGGNGVFLGGEVALSGEIKGGATIKASHIQLGGKIGKDVSARAGELSVGPDAVIGGNLEYTSGNKAAIDPGAKIGGEVIYSISPVKEFLGEHWKNRLITGSRLLALLMNLIFSFVFGMIFIKIFPAGFQNALYVLKHKPWKALGMGLLSIILLPLVCLILLITILGFPIALALIAFSLLTFYTAKILPIIWIGNSLFSKLKIKLSTSWVLLFGLILFFLVLQIPFVGSIVSVSFILLGVGSATLGQMTKSIPRK